MITVQRDLRRMRPLRQLRAGRVQLLRGTILSIVFYGTIRERMTG